MSCALQRACANRNIGSSKSGVPTYRIRSRQLLRIQSVFFGAVTGTSGTVCGRENALRSCIGLSGKCLLTRRENQYCSCCFVRGVCRMQSSLKQKCERDGIWFQSSPRRTLKTAVLSITPCSTSVPGPLPNTTTSSTVGSADFVYSAAGSRFSTGCSLCPPKDGSVVADLLFGMFAAP